MDELNENLTLSLIFANTKKKKRKIDLLTLGKCFQFLIKLYGNRKELAKKVDLSPEMIRQFLLVFNLPQEIQKEVELRSIDSVDIIRYLVSLKDPSKQINIANMAKNLPSKDIRDIIRLTDNNLLSETEAKTKLIEAKPKKLNIFIIDLDDELNRIVIKESKRLKIKPGEYIKRLVVEKLNEKIPA